MTDLTTLFSPDDFHKNDSIILKMNNSNSIKAIDKTNVTEQKKFRLSEINGIENYFYQQINQRKSYLKNLIDMLLFLIT